MNKPAIAESQTGLFYDERQKLRRCRCQKCVDVRSCAFIFTSKKISIARGDVEHFSRTVVHWDERDPDDRYWRILITCHKCGHDRFTPKSSIKNPTWQGYCPECAPIYSPVKGRRTLKGQYKNPFGALIDYDAPHGYNRALVYYPNFSTCGGKSQMRVDASNQDKQPFYCDGCFTRDKSSRMSSAWAALKGGPQNSDGQRDIERTQDLIEFIEAVSAVRKMVQNPALSLDEQLAMVTQIRVAEYLRLGAAGEPASANQLSAKLRRRGVNKMFPDAPSWFRAFVETVVTELGQGKPPETVAIGLARRLERAASAA